MKGSRACLAAAGLLLAGASAPGVALGAAHGSALAYPLVARGPAPDLVLAQRTIDRQWGASEDSTYVEVNVPEWRSEGGAALLSAVIPGAGHFYVGEGSWVWFALAEVAGWTAHLVFDGRGEDSRRQAEHFAGDPRDTSSAWSFERWQGATGGDPAALEAIYARDPKAFYYVIGSDPAYLAGWSGNPAATRGTFEGLRDDAETQFRRANQAGTLLWLNHLVAAADALRAARLHNMPLRRNLDIRLKSSWRGGRPAFVASLERRF